MRKRMEDGADVRPWRWAGPEAVIAERTEQMKEFLNTVRMEGFMKGLLAGLIAESIVVITAVALALR